MTKIVLQSKKNVVQYEFKVLCQQKGVFQKRILRKKREINKKALMAYYEKYKHLIRDKNAYLYIEELFKKMI